MRRALAVTLGIVTSIGGYLDVGAIATAAQAGALFGFQHLWVIAAGTICVVALVEMSGRLAAVSGHTLRGATRERMGLNFFAWTSLVDLGVSVLVLAAELGGVALALQLVTGIGARWWVVPVAVVAWWLLWRGTFGILEKSIGLLGLVTLAFAVGAVKTGPDGWELLRGFVPSAPAQDAPRYWFVAASIIGALVSPYLFYFYSSGAVEDGWGDKDLGINRSIAAAGMGFGSIAAFGVLIAAAMVLHPRGIRVDTYDQAVLMLTVPLGRAGLYLFAASLAIACFGAALEIALTIAYELAQGFGWEWGENRRPHEAPRFALAYTVALAIGVLPVLLGADPLHLTVATMALTAVTLPLVILPFLAIMNDREYLRQHSNGPIGNLVVLAVVAVTFVLAIVTIPLQIMGG